MGLLDDAIREHLELRRLRGADPGEVAREEHEALGPVLRDDEAAHDGSEGQAEVPLETDGSFFPGSEAAPEADLSSVGQETAEIDMDAMLDPDTGFDSDPDSASAPSSSSVDRAAPVAHPAHSQAAAEESLEWEVPGEHPEELVEHPDGHDEDPEAEDHVDDVLKETPDFLRETPEQERLWFEQRPPRDFDFNE